MKSLNEDIKQGQFKNIYLLYGEEDYLKKQYRDRLVKAMLPEGDTVNYAHYEGKGLPVGEIIDLAETMPFFAERRCPRCAAIFRALCSVAGVGCKTPTP